MKLLGRAEASTYGGGPLEAVAASYVATTVGGRRKVWCYSDVSIM